MILVNCGGFEYILGYSSDFCSNFGSLVVVLLISYTNVFLEVNYVINYVNYS